MDRCRLVGSWAILPFCVIFYIMFPPSFPMTENRKHTPWFGWRFLLQWVSIYGCYAYELDKLLSRPSYQRDQKNCTILCCVWTMTWIIYTSLAFPCIVKIGRQLLGKLRGGGLCLFVNSKWWAISNVQELEYLMKSCRTHYFPKQFSSAVLYIFRSCLFTTTNKCCH